MALKCEKDQWRTKYGRKRWRNEKDKENKRTKLCNEKGKKWMKERKREKEKIKNGKRKKLSVFKLVKIKRNAKRRLKICEEWRKLLQEERDEKYDIK